MDFLPENMYKRPMEQKVDFLENYKCRGDLLEVYTYPHSVLKKKASPVSNFDTELLQLVKNMLYTMYQAPGIGLAAPQVGVSKKIFVIDPSYKRKENMLSNGDSEYLLSNLNPMVFINPSIISKEGEIVHEEGCLSVPGIYEKVKRAQKITIEYQDLLGNKKSMDAENVLSVCIQHENDHLDGIIFLEQLSLIKRKLLTKKYLKQRDK